MSAYVEAVKRSYMSIEDLANSLSQIRHTQPDVYERTIGNLLDLTTFLFEQAQFHLDRLFHSEKIPLDEAINYESELRKQSNDLIQHIVSTSKKS